MWPRDRATRSEQMEAISAGATHRCSPGTSTIGGDRECVSAEPVLVFLSALPLPSMRRWSRAIRIRPGDPTSERKSRGHRPQLFESGRWRRLTRTGPARRRRRDRKRERRWRHTPQTSGEDSVASLTGGCESVCASHRPGQTRGDDSCAPSGRPPSNRQGWHAVLTSGGARKGRDAGCIAQPQAARRCSIPASRIDALKQSRQSGCSNYQTMICAVAARIPFALSPPQRRPGQGSSLPSRVEPRPQQPSFLPLRPVSLAPLRPTRFSLLPLLSCNRPRRTDGCTRTGHAAAAGAAAGYAQARHNA